MAKLKRPGLKQPGSKPSLSPKPNIKPAVKPAISKTSPMASKLAAKVTTREVVEISGEEVIFDEPASAYDTIPEKIKHIEAILAAEELPVTRLKSGLKDVMQCIKDNEDSIQDLAATDIATIVSGYMRLASDEERKIVEGAKPKKPKKPSKSAALKKVEQLAKEIDLDSVDF